MSAVEQGLQPGTSEYPFSGDYFTKGCYMYTSASDTYANVAFFGTGGSQTDMEAALILPKVRLLCSTDKHGFYTSNKDQDCDSVCGTQGLGCHDGTYSTLDWYQMMDSASEATALWGASGLLCNSYNGGETATPRMYGSGLCQYINDPAAGYSCSTKGTTFQNLCWCEAINSCPSPPSPPPPSPSPPPPSPSPQLPSPPQPCSPEECGRRQRRLAEKRKPSVIEWAWIVSEMLPARAWHVRLDSSAHLGVCPSYDKNADSGDAASITGDSAMKQMVANTMNMARSRECVWGAEPVELTPQLTAWLVAGATESVNPSVTPTLDHYRQH